MPITKYVFEKTAELDAKYGPVITLPQHMQNQLCDKSFSNIDFANHLKTLLDTEATFSVFKVAELVAENFNTNSDTLLRYLQKQTNGYCLNYIVKIEELNCRVNFWWVKESTIWRLLFVRDQTNVQPA